MSNIKQVIKNWLPEYLRSVERWEDYIDAVGDLFEEVHGELSSYENYLSIDDVAESYLSNLEHMFGVSQSIPSIDIENRRYYLNRIVQLIQLKGIDASLNFISGLLGVGIVYKTLWANNAYTTFTSTQQNSDDFLSSHIEIELVLDPNNSLYDFTTEDQAYVELLDDFVTMFNDFRGIEIVVDRIISTMPVQSSVPMISAALFTGEQVTIQPPLVLDAVVTGEVPVFAATYIISETIIINPL